MKIRPHIKIGDIVKLSKKGKTYSRTFPKDSTLVVCNIDGDGIDRKSIIRCRVANDGNFEHHTFYRSELWSTGISIFDLPDK
jgi:hypothetical protein